MLMLNGLFLISFPYPNSPSETLEGSKQKIYLAFNEFISLNKLSGISYRALP